MAVNFDALNTVYNHYLTSYAPNGSSPFDSHKKSELRNIYNSIIKLNKESPLYIFNSSKETQALAVGIKENARTLHNTIASLSNVADGDLLGKKIAKSTNENIASVTFVGDSSNSDNVPTFDLEVVSLATNQVNTGNFLPTNTMGLKPNEYSFDISINQYNYEFQFQINTGETNKAVQEKLARLINNSNIGIEASVVDDAKGNSALRLQSHTTGLPKEGDVHFTVTDDKTSKRAGAASYFGVNQVSRAPSNAEFILNGNEHLASSNTFLVEKMYQITLNGVSPEEGITTNIGLKDDYESLKENVTGLMKGYNDFLKAAMIYQSNYPKSGKLVSDMKHISNYYQQDLVQYGFHVNDKGDIALDDNYFSDSFTTEDSDKLLFTMKQFASTIMKKTSQISLNPMQYVDKTIVAYKNPGKSFPNPYMTSAYSGMMFNSYC